MFTEKVLIEDYIVKQLQEQGWEFIPADELEREGYEEPLLIQNLIRAVEKINKDLFRLSMTGEMKKRKRKFERSKKGIMNDLLTCKNGGECEEKESIYW
jgi:type I site-specific restriction-modification system R (restriction) subunit